MSARLPVFILFLFLTTDSCTKNNSVPAGNLDMLQHKWILVSRNGEALRYVGQPGDYFDFDTNGTLIEYLSNTNDSFDYTLSGKTLSLYPVLKGIHSTVGQNYHVDVLTDSELIFSFHSPNPPVNAVDSLRR